MNSVQSSNASLAILPTVAPGYGLEVFHAFGSGRGDGANPFAGLVQDTQGNLYGTTYNGGTNGMTSFRMTMPGSYALAYTFTNGPDGAHPYSSLIRANDGSLYGTTSAGGSNSVGAIYCLTNGGTFSHGYSFAGATDNRGAL